MPDVRAFMASGYYNGKIYLVGGYTTGNVAPAFLQAGSTIRSPTPSLRPAYMPATLEAGSGVINGHLYVAGGRDSPTRTSTRCMTTTLLPTHGRREPICPAGVNVPGSAVIGGKLWIFGGGDPSRRSGHNAYIRQQKIKSVVQPAASPGYHRRLEVYDPATNTWSSGPSLNHPRSYPAATMWVTQR